MSSFTAFSELSRGPGAALRAAIVFAILLPCLVAIDLATLGPGETLTREGGAIEIASALSYLVAVAVYLLTTRSRAFWPVPVTLLLMSAREFDADKRFTQEGLLSTKILVRDTQLWEKGLAICVWTLVAVTLVLLLRHRARPFVAGLRRGVPWALACAGGIALAAISKSIDGLARKLAPWDIAVPPAIDAGAGTIEECLEIFVPVLFTIAILLRAPSRAEGRDGGS